MNGQTITHSDARTVFRLIGECQELGDDAAVWRSHLMAGISKLVGAELIFHATITEVHEQQTQMRAPSALGFEDGFNLKEWRAIHAEYGPSLRSTMFARMLELARGTSKPGITKTRQALIPTREWESTFDYQVISRPVGTDPNIHSYHWVAGGHHLLDAITICRAKGRRQFNVYEEMLVHLLHGEIVRDVGGRLAGPEEPQPSRLPLRVRQVLRCLLEGDGDKQIAQRLQISNHTVNQYTKAIYRFFHVSGRAELFARWTKRGWKLNQHEWQACSEIVHY